jgi:hypothetical protein
VLGVKIDSGFVPQNTSGSISSIYAGNVSEIELGFQK